MATVDETTQKVQRILSAQFSDVKLAKNGFSFEHGSTVVFIEIRDWGKDKDGNPSSLVYLNAPIGRKVKQTPELFKWVATEGRQKYFGGVTVGLNEGTDECYLLYDHTLLGDFLDPAELSGAISALAWTADDLDEIVHDRFGGLRWTDPTPPDPTPPDPTPPDPTPPDPNPTT